MTVKPGQLYVPARKYRVTRPSPKDLRMYDLWVVDIAGRRGMMRVFGITPPGNIHKIAFVKFADFGARELTAIYKAGDGPWRHAWGEVSLVRRKRG